MFVLFLTGMALIKYGLGLPSGHSGCSFVYVFVPGHLLSDDSIRGKVPLAGPDLFSLSEVAPLSAAALLIFHVDA